MKYDKQKRIMIYILSLMAVLLCGGCSMQGSEKVTYTDTAMGTIIQQTLYLEGDYKQVQTDVVQDGTGNQKSLPLDIMSLLNSLEQDTLSWRMEGAEIYRINMSDTAEGYRVSENMQEYLEVISTVWEKSSGALDVTVGEVTRLWNIDAWAKSGMISTEQEETALKNIGAENSGQQDSGQMPAEFCPPTEKDIQAALSDTGFEKVRIEDDRIYLPENMQLDLGAVGKGIACDEIRKMLQQQDAVTGAVISIGGSVLTYGEKPDGSSWKVGIQHPRTASANIATIQLKGNYCVSTSGDYERYVEKDGVRYHHIMDPGNGYPADSGVISVTIVSESGLISDALSTACFVLGKDEGLNLAESFGAEAYIIDKELNIYMTDGMKLFICD